MNDALQIAAVIGTCVALLTYFLGLMQGSLTESRKKLKEETTATYYPFYTAGSKRVGYVKVYKSSILLGEDDDR